MLTESSVDRNLYEELDDQGLHPPGADPSLGCFYKAVTQMIDAGHTIGIVLGETKRARPDITDKHFASLLFRVVQFIKFREGDLSYAHFSETSQWREELDRIATTQPMIDEFSEGLRRRSTATTIYQRYAGPHVTIAHFYDGHPVLVADLGCGGNYGLRGIELQEPFQQIIDSTPYSTVSTLLNQRINLEKGLAIDKEEPDDPQVREWRFACSLYPQELSQLPEMREFEERIRGSQRVQFLKADLLTLDLDWFLSHGLDVVILSTILYQLQRPEQLTLIDKAKRLIKPGGMLVVQDFARKDSSNPFLLDFSNSWFDNKFSYRTFLATSKNNNWQFLETLQWNNGRCISVKPGEDFDEVFRDPGRYQLKTASAAFAHSTS